MVIYMEKDKKSFYLNTKIVIIILIFMIISLLSIYSSQKLLSSSYNNL